MCFSAPASFVAGTALVAVGVATLRNTRAKNERLFAMMPLLFGTQQLVEGVIWLTFSHDSPILKQALTYLYSGFSHVLWPMYVPLAVGAMETVPWRKRAMFAFEVPGAVVGLYLLYYLIASPVVAEVVGNHIVYVSPHFYQIPVMLLYLAATCVSGLFSSHLFVNLFGVLALFAFRNLSTIVRHPLREITELWRCNAPHD